MYRRLVWFALGLAVGLLGCPGPAGEPDSGVPADAGHPDASVADAGRADAGQDAGQDAGTDAGLPDSGVDGGGDASVDAGVFSPVFAQCGNGLCEPGETQSCADCPATAGTCGDGTCNVGENSSSCFADCRPILMDGGVLPSLPDLATGGQRWKNYAGGLYPDGGNVLPADHLAAGLAQAARITPLAVDGTPDPVSGRIVLLSIGMSNTTQEFCHFNGVDNHQPGSCMPWTLSGRARDDQAVEHTHLVLINGARGGMSAENWTSPSRPHVVPAPTGCGPFADPNNATLYPSTPSGAAEKLGVFGPGGLYDEEYDRINACNLKAQGLSFRQVQVALVKLSRADPTAGVLPDSNADAYNLERDLGNVVRTLKSRYPNLRQVYLSSRVWGGFSGASTAEPFSFETGFGVKWLIEAQVNQLRNGGQLTVPTTAPGFPGDLDYTTGVAPWLAWGGYLWANYNRPTSGDATWFGNTAATLYDGGIASELTDAGFVQALTLPAGNGGNYTTWCGAGSPAPRVVVPGPQDPNTALQWCDSDYFTLVPNGQRANGATAMYGWASDFLQEDGTHPTHDGEAKVGSKWLHFFKNSPTSSCWFLAGRSCR